MSCEWEDRRLYLSVSLRNEIRIGEIHLGAICKQMVIEVIKVKRDIQCVPRERRVEIVEAVFGVRVKGRRVRN